MLLISKITLKSFTHALLCNLILLNHNCNMGNGQFIMIFVKIIS